MDLQKWIAFHIFLSLNLVSITIADIGPNHEYHECGTRGRYTQDSTYSKNLDTLLSSLSKNISEYGFYKGSVGQDSERASAIVLCRGDVELNVCRSCISDNAQRIKQRCPNQKEAFRWYNICSIYYSDESITGSLRTTPKVVQYSNISYPYPAQFSEDLTNMVGRLRRQAADGGPFLKYAANSTAGSDLQTIYAYVQCTPDLSHQDCTDCLSTAFTLWYKSNGNGKIRARVLCPSCFFHYENSSFFGATLIKVPPSAPPPPSPPSHRIAIVIVVSTVTGLIMITICIFLMQKRKAKSYAANVEESSSGDEISPVESHLKYELITIQTATDNFSKANKVGEGRFGAVYKGKLENRQLVAVKRLSENSRQVNLELKNEMALMARLQHRNLVRLLGYCLDGRTEILVYDFVPNGGLDSILFDPVKRGCLDWGRRYKIIESIARGLAYLHEGSHHRIIHCNLKASNILLDVDLNPKIADFGMARLFALDKTHGSTSAIMGTYGYIAPEYALYSQFSVKSDVYSFGVLVLEIISGQKSSNFQNGESIEDLLSYAWTHFKSGAASNVIDPMLRAVSSPVHEITKCIHIALLCVQESVVDRPTMFEVLQMLSNLSMSLPVPLAPGFSIHGSVNTEASSQFTKSEMSNSSDQYPRKMQKRKANRYAKISALESLKCDFSTIQNGTDNFSDANMVGIGTLGPVYKCKLENGLEVVAKRCSENSWLGRQEFKNEVSLLAKLQHRNFVRLLGSCQEGKEMLLVYEFVSNGGLDQFLFDPIKRGYLDWGRRYKIIESIARGLVYLHEDSNLRIIHRNLTVSNVLLDADLNPKISNFSLAWLFTSDKTHCSTDQIVGAYDVTTPHTEYMAPEYSWHGQFSVKSDVYSFGVLSLEIISGQKHGYFQNGESIKSLLSYAWTHWKNGSSLNVIDPMLRGVSSPVPDIIKCVQVALLCVQEKVEDRPTMGEVVQMLSNLSTSLPVPSAPPFVIPSRVSSDDASRVSSDDAEGSINEMPISDDDKYPR